MMALLALTVMTGCQKKTETAAAETKETATVATAAVNPVEAAAADYFINFPGNRMITAEDIFKKMDAGEDLFLLDIRKPSDYEAGHLKGAVNAAWGSPALADALNWLPDDQTIYVNCVSGQTAGQTIAVLNTAGFDAVSIRYGYKLGIAKTEGYENYIETAANPAPEPSGVVLDPALKAAAEDYFNSIPENGSNIIAAAKMKELVDTEEGLTIVSVRQPKDYEAGHIQGAINIPWGAGMQEAFADLPRDEKVYVYCYSGQTAGQTVGIMRLMGIDAVSIKSGMGTAGTGGSGWANEGFETVM